MNENELSKIAGASEEKSYLTLVSLRRLLEISGIKNYRDSAESRHRLAMSIFPRIEEIEARSAMGILFRGERTAQDSTVLIRSRVAPANVPGVRTVREDFSRLTASTNIRFRLTASPIRRSGSKELAILKFEELEEWLEAKLSPALKSVELIQLKDEELRRGKSRNFVKLVQIDGVGTVENSASLVELLQNGVGRNRSYGAGLLTVAVI